MKKLKVGTRVIVKGIETFISELHADIERGVYKVRTSNPTYEFTKHPATGAWFTHARTDSNMVQDCIVLREAPKYGGYQVGDRVFCSSNGVGIVDSIGNSAFEFPVRVLFNKECIGYTLEGKCYHADKQPVLKKLRIKLGEKK